MVQVTSGASGPEVRTATTAGAGDPRVVENLWIGGGVRCDVGTPEYHPGPPHPGHPPGCSALLPPHPHLELGGHLAAAERVHRAEELGRAPARSEERRVGKVCGSRWSMIERENKIYIYQ